jgi:hypothetical protein
MLSDNKLELLEELDRILTLEIDTYQKFLELELRAKALLIARSLDILLVNIQEKERLTQHLIGLESQRQGVAERLAAQLQIPASEMTLTHLVTQVTEPHASRLRRYRDRLRQLVLDVQRCGADNARYLQGALSFFNDALTFFQHVIPTHTTYRQSGQTPCPQRGRILSGRA